LIAIAENTDESTGLPVKVILPDLLDKKEMKQRNLRRQLFGKSTTGFLSWPEH
jgi:hypothetical protein